MGVCTCEFMCLCARGTQRVSSSITFYLAFQGQGLSLKLALTDSARLVGNELCRAVCLQTPGLELQISAAALDSYMTAGDLPEISGARP